MATPLSPPFILSSFKLVAVVVVAAAAVLNNLPLEGQCKRNNLTHWVEVAKYSR